LHIEFKKSELHAIAKTLGQSIEAFQRESMSAVFMHIAENRARCGKCLGEYPTAIALVLSM
jgi:hypothetical protein